MKTVLLTGSTGSFGGFLAAELLKYAEVKLILLVRGKTEEEAQARVQSFLEKGRGIEVYRADLTEEYLGLTPENYQKLAQRVTHILHSAASTRFNLGLEEARVHNVKTTEQILKFAQACTQLSLFGFLSTAHIFGKRTGVMLEDEFEHTAGFNNFYQATKYEAEALVRSHLKEFPIVIFRPPLVISSDHLSSSPKRSKNFLQVLINLIAQGLLPCVAGTPQSTMDLVDATDSARAIIQLMLKEKLAHLTYHVTNGREAVTIGLLHEMVEEKTHKKIPVEYCGNEADFRKRVSEVVQKAPQLGEVYRRAESFLVEPAYPKTFDNSYLLADLGIERLGESAADTLRRVFNTQVWNLSE